MATVGINEFYDFYRRTSKSPVSADLFKEVLRSYNDSLTDILIEDGKVNLYRMSCLQIVRLKTNPTTVKVDWNQSLKLKQSIIDSGGKLWDGKEGEKWVTYFDQKWYPLFHWDKKTQAFRVKNRLLFTIKVARGATGPKEKLKKKLRSDDMAYLKYPWYHGIAQIR